MLITVVTKILSCRKESVHWGSMERIDKVLRNFFSSKEFCLGDRDTSVCAHIFHAALELFMVMEQDKIFYFLSTIFFFWS